MPLPPGQSDLHRLIDAHADLALREEGAGAEWHARPKHGIIEMLLGEALRYRWRMATEAIIHVFASGIELNAQGRGAWLEARK